MTQFDKIFIFKENPWLKKIILLEETASTQKELEEQDISTLCIAKRQSAGYGRFQRQYFSAKNGGVYMSLTLSTKDFKNPAQLTLLAAVATVSAIRSLTNKEVLIKWVNDIYLNNKKIIGILCEQRGGNLILGMGINFHITDFPDYLSDVACSIFNEENPTISESELISKIWSEFQRLKDEDYLSFYKKYCFVLGKKISFSQNSSHFDGIAIDLTSKGELIVNCTDGITRTLNSGEISLDKLQF
ncbi:MAG: biotin--[acetyl-CoA-carboxylase] ligase [Lactovum sp.]